MYEFNEAVVSVELSGRQAGRETESWLFVLPIGRHVAVDKKTGETFDFEVTESLAQDLASESRRATYNFSEYVSPDQTPFKFPVLAEHVPEGATFGDLLDFKVAGEGAKRGLYVRTRWNALTWNDIQHGTRKYVSAGIVGQYVDDKGVTYGPIVREVSLTAQPRLKSIGTIQDTLNLELSEVERVTIEELQQENEALKAKIAELEAPELEAPELEAPELEAPELEAPELEAPELEAVSLSDVVAELRALLEVVSKREAPGNGLNFSETGNSGGTPPAPVRGAQALAKAKEKGLKGVDAVLASRGLK